MFKPLIEQIEINSIKKQPVSQTEREAAEYNVVFNKLPVQLESINENLFDNKAMTEKEVNDIAAEKEANKKAEQKAAREEKVKADKIAAEKHKEWESKQTKMNLEEKTDILARYSVQKNISGMTFNINFGALNEREDVLEKKIKDLKDRHTKELEALKPLHQKIENFEKPVRDAIRSMEDTIELVVSHLDISTEAEREEIEDLHFSEVIEKYFTKGNINGIIPEMIDTLEEGYKIMEVLTNKLIAAHRSFEEKYGKDPRVKKLIPNYEHTKKYFDDLIDHVKGVGSYITNMRKKQRTMAFNNNDASNLYGKLLGISEKLRELYGRLTHVDVGLKTIAMEERKNLSKLTSRYFRESALSEQADILARYGVEGYNKPKRTPSHKTKSHLVVAKKDDKVKVIRFGAQGAKGSPKKDGESESYKKRRQGFVARHKAQNPGGLKDKMSALYWANKVKW
jgi:hypothetical protein